jgi:hypothetical protein
MIRRITLIGLACIFLYNLLGYYPVFELRQYNVRSEIRSRIKQVVSDQQLEKLVFTPGAYSRLKWVEHKSEFTFAGELYDVVRTEIAEGKVVIFCINDNKEQALISAYDRHVLDHIKDNPAQQKNKQKTPLKVIKDLYFNSLSSQGVYSSDILAAIFPDKSPVPVPFDIPVPPPRHIS